MRTLCCFREIYHFFIVRSEFATVTAGCLWGLPQRLKSLGQEKGGLSHNTQPCQSLLHHGALLRKPLRCFSDKQTISQESFLVSWYFMIYMIFPQKKLMIYCWDLLRPSRDTQIGSWHAGSPVLWVSARGWEAPSRWGCPKDINLRMVVA